MCYEVFLVCYNRNPLKGLDVLKERKCLSYKMIRSSTLSDRSLGNAEKLGERELLMVYAIKNAAAYFNLNIFFLLKIILK